MPFFKRADKRPGPGPTREGGGQLPDGMSSYQLLVNYQMVWGPWLPSTSYPGVAAPRQQTPGGTKQLPAACAFGGGVRCGRAKPSELHGIRK